MLHPLWTVGRRVCGRAPWVAAAVAIAAGAAVPSLATATSTRGATAKKPAKATRTVTSRTVIRRVHVRANGTYAVIVGFAPQKANQSVDVFVGSEAQRHVLLTPSLGAKLAFSVNVSTSAFNVRVVSHGPNVPFSVASALQQSPTAPPPAVTAAGSTSPTGPVTGPYNTLVWSDEFTGAAGSAANPANWTADSGGGCGDGTLSNNTMNLANAALTGAGQLGITADGPTSTPPYATAQIDTFGHFSFTYGRIEARIRTQPGQGLCSAFWLVADDGEQVGWPNGGEMDIMEQIGNTPSQTNGFLHGPITGVGANDQQWYGSAQSALPLAGSYHTYGLIWKPNSLTWTLDGVPFATATAQTFPPTARWVFNGHPFHIILDEAVGGWPGEPSASTVFPASMLVDWVRVYQ
jgi:beta-glucanase (GH16 family)